MKRIIRNLVLLVLCNTTWCLAGETSTTAPAVVAVAAGEPVTAEEVRLAMERRKAEVFAWFREHHGLEDHSGYWSEGGALSSSPISRLREMAMGDLKEMKSLMHVAKERGLIADITHTGFLRELGQENVRRREMASSGGVIYGPRQYSVQTYHSIRYRDTVHRLKQVLMEEASRVLTDTDVENYRREHPGEFSKGTPEQNREATLKHLRDAHAERAMSGIVSAAEVSVVDEAAFNAISPRVDPAE